MSLFMFSCLVIIWTGNQWLPSTSCLTHSMLILVLLVEGFLIIGLPPCTLFWTSPSPQKLVCMTWCGLYTFAEAFQVLWPSLPQRDKKCPIYSIFNAHSWKIWKREGVNKSLLKMQCLQKDKITVFTIIIIIIIIMSHHQHLSLSSIASCGYSRLHLVSAQSCCM